MAFPFVGREEGQTAVEPVNLNVLDNDQLPVTLVEQRIIHNVLDVLLVALCEVEHGFGVAIGRRQDALTIRVLTDAF